MISVWIFVVFVYGSTLGPDLPVGETHAFSSQQKCEQWVSQHHVLGRSGVGMEFPKCDEIKIE